MGLTVSALPVPAMKTVYVTNVKTVWESADEATSTSSPDASSPATAAAATPTLSSEQGLNAGVKGQEAAPAAQSTSSAVGASSETQAPSSSSAETASSSSSSQASPSASSSGGSFKGQGTYYTPDVGACGKTNTESDMIVAVSQDLYKDKQTGNNPNNNPICGRKIKATYQGKSVEVTVADACVGCKYYDLDFSPAAFSKIADKDLGRIDISWEWAD